MLGAITEFEPEQSCIAERVKAGPQRARDVGTRLARVKSVLAGPAVSFHNLIFPNMWRSA
jgi:hypothetical protein